MGGMFTILKVRDNIKTYDDVGWYEHPEGTVSENVNGKGMDMSMEGSHSEMSVKYVCPMHSDVRMEKPGSCPKCGMTLKPKQKEKGK